MEDKYDQTYDALFRTFSAPNPHSHGVLKMLQSIYPSLAKKIFQNNEFMERVLLSNYSPDNILNFYVCGKCETIAARDGSAWKNKRKVPVCQCKAKGCGARTIDPPTFRTWLTDELRRKAPPDVAAVAEFIVDDVALRLTRKAMQDYRILAGMSSEERSPELILPNGMRPTQSKRVTMDRIATDDEVQANNAQWEKLRKKQENG
jgi:hypothetical protein